MRAIIVFALSTIMTTSQVYSYDAGSVEFFTPNPALYDRVKIFEDPTPNDAWYARAVISNVRGMYNETETDSTELGNVHIRYITSPPSDVGDPDSADEACVVGLPDNVFAIPECVVIMEEETETIYLYEYFGG
jgi:hypothetical protein